MNGKEVEIKECEKIMEIRNDTLMEECENSVRKGVDSNHLKKFMDTLDIDDMNVLEESLIQIRSIPLVCDIELEEPETNTIIIRLSEMNREIEEKIFQIEYNLLKKLKTDVDFLVLPV
jgi:hypothetical protein